MSPARIRSVLAALGVLCVLGMLQAATQWQHARRAVAAVAAAFAPGGTTPGGTTPGGTTPGGTTPGGTTPGGATPGRTTPPAFDSSLPEAVLAHAVALSRTGRYPQALQTFKALLSERTSIRLTALYDLGNLNLRESLRYGTGEAQRALPLVELSKQSYRDVLREDPQDWDARYNLERALWLSPEYDDPVLQRNQAPTHSEHAASTLQGARIDLP